MRTRQIQLLNKARACNFSAKQIEMLSREEIPMQILLCAYDYMLLHNRQQVPENDTAIEVGKWFDFMIMQNQAKKLSAKQWAIVMSKFLPHSYVTKDTLLGNDEKLRLWTAYKFTQYIIDNYPTLNRNKIYTTLILYSFLVYENVEYKNIKMLIKQIAYGNADAHKLLYAFAGYDMLIDDYKYNYQASLIWQVVKLGLLDDFMIDPIVLTNAYDYHLHRFTENILANFE